MYEITSKQFNTAIGKTSPHILEAGLAEETCQKIYTLSSRHNIAKKSSDIAAVIGYVLVGLVPVKRFIQALQEDTGLDTETAKNIAHDVRAEIFAPIAKELATMQEQAEKNWQELHRAQNTTQEPQPVVAASLPADESIVREVLPAPEVDEKKFDTGLEQPEKKEGDKDERF